MKNLHVKHATISAVVIYLLGITSFLGSFFVSILSDPEFQANVILMIAIVPASLLGAHLYYRRGHSTHGILLGASFFLVAMILDAIITVPLFVIPAGGTYASFYGDPGFWLIAVVYIGAVAAYWRLWVRKNNPQISEI